MEDALISVAVFEIWRWVFAAGHARKTIYDEVYERVLVSDDVTHRPPVAGERMHRIGDLNSPKSTN